jgi:coilin
MVATPVRLRLVFDSGRLHQRGQRDGGLRRCWLLVLPELTTISDLAALVDDHFRLGRSCLSGSVLSVGASVLSSGLDSFPSLVSLPL